MKLTEFKKIPLPPLRQVSLCLLMKGDEILLAMKKKGFGKGRWNGVGGKPKDGENIEQAAKREAKEEIDVILKELVKIATLSFYFPHNSDWNQQVIVYLSKEWEGEPKETEEMAPKWHKKNQLPLDSMWLADTHWMPLVLEGKKLEAEFLYGESDTLLDYKVTEIT